MADSVGRGPETACSGAPGPGPARRTLRIAFVSGWDAEDPAAWSGVVRPMRQAFARALPVTTVRVTAKVHPVDRALARLSGALGRGYLCDHAFFTARRRGAALRSQLEGADVDVVVAVACSATVACAGLEIPVVQVTDATVRALRGYYPQFTGLATVSTWQAERLERCSHRASAAVVTTSRWARDSFLRDYGVAEELVSVAPFGPAIVPESTSPDREPPDPHALRLLVVAKDWARKGGDAALAAVSRLRDRGCPARLTVVGETPVDLPEWARPVGRVTAEQLSAFYLQHDALLELAAANAGGVTLTDAAAHGLPVVATRTGGVADIVRDGETGFLVTGPHETDRALDALRTPEVRGRLARGALVRSREVLGWDVWAAHVVEVVEGAYRARGDGGDVVVGNGPEPGRRRERIAREQDGGGTARGGQAASEREVGA